MRNRKRLSSAALATAVLVTAFAGSAQAQDPEGSVIVSEMDTHKVTVLKTSQFVAIEK